MTEFERKKIQEIIRGMNDEEREVVVDTLVEIYEEGKDEE